MPDEYFSLRLDLADSLATYSDETEFASFMEALSVAKYVALNGYPFGDRLRMVKLVKVVKEHVEITMHGKDYEPK